MILTYEASYCCSECNSVRIVILQISRLHRPRNWRYGSDLSICRWLFFIVIHAISKSHWPYNVTRPAAAIKSLRFALYIDYRLKIFKLLFCAKPAYFHHSKIVGACNQSQSMASMCFCYYLKFIEVFWRVLSFHPYSLSWGCIETDQFAWSGSNPLSLLDGSCEGVRPMSGLLNCGCMIIAIWIDSIESFHVEQKLFVINYWDNYFWNYIHNPSIILYSAYSLT